MRAARSTDSVPSVCVCVPRRALAAATRPGRVHGARSTALRGGGLALCSGENLGTAAFVPKMTRFAEK